MRESLGGSMLLNLVIIFAGLVMVFFVGILSYSKAYRVKNRIIEIIEKYEGYENVVTEELNQNLANAGYNTSMPSRCDDIESRLDTEKFGDDWVTTGNLNNFGYDYCVFRVNNSENPSGKYYIVVTFVHFEFPIIEELLTFPVYGETKILGKTYNY